MPTAEDIDAVLWQLLGRLGEVDDDLRALLPSQRTIEARCPDIDYVRYAEWRRGAVVVLDEPPARRADIRISVRSDDLMDIVSGDLPFARAYATNRVRLDASMTDLLRLRALL